MKLRSLLVAGLALAFASLHAETKIAPAVVVQAIHTDDTDAYVAAIAKINARIKALTGVDQLRHVWQGDFAGENSHGLFVVSHYDSAAAVYALGDKITADPEMKGIMAGLKSTRKLGAARLYKAVRDDGLYAGGATYNTSINATDEAGYLAALDGLKTILDANGFKDAKLNVWRIAAGRDGEATHVVLIALPSKARVAELVDALTDKGLTKDWNVTAAKFRTVVRNGTYSEITK